LQPSKS